MPEAVWLDEKFYTNLIKHPPRVRGATIRQSSSRRSMAMDVHVWHAYPLHEIANPTSLSWRAVFRDCLVITGISLRFGRPKVI